MEQQEQQSGFKQLLYSMMHRRWMMTLLVLVTFMAIAMGILLSIHTSSEVSGEWKELLLLLLGALIGSYGKIIDYWFSDTDKDKMLVQKMDEEDGTTLSHTNDMKESNKPVAPIIPDAFVVAASHAHQMNVVENHQEFELKKDQQEHEQEMEKLEFEFQSHRQCEHVWVDSDYDGDLECDKCGKIKD